VTVLVIDAESGAGNPDSGAITLPGPAVREPQKPEASAPGTPRAVPAPETAENGL